MNEIRYVVGDATSPHGSGPRAIIHICNNIGAWGAGFVMALSRRWPEAERSYREWYGSDRDFGLGLIQPVLVDSSSGPLWVINMVAQHGVGGDKENPPIRYKALRQCLNQVADFAERKGATIHAPRIGCGLAGGDWSTVSKLIQETLTDKGYDVTIYDLGGSGSHQGKSS